MSAEKTYDAVKDLMSRAENTDDLAKLKQIEQALIRLGAWDFARWVNTKRQHIEREQEATA